MEDLDDESVIVATRPCCLVGRKNGGERRENKVQGISFYPTVAIEKPRPEIKHSH